MLPLSVTVDFVVLLKQRVDLDLNHALLFKSAYHESIKAKGARCRNPAMFIAEVTVRTFLTVLISFAPIGLLAGCATQAQQAAYAQHEMERTMAVYGPACEKLGYAANTDSWRNCVMQLSYKDDTQGYGFVARPYWVY